MSQWTHVNCSIRVDIFPFIGKDDTKIIKERLGTPALFDSPEKDWKNCKLPKGSEGSLQYFINENPHFLDGKTNGQRFDVITIFGDLRDYDDEKAIGIWFKNLIQGMMIRQAICEIEVEGNPTVIYLFESAGDKIKRFILK